MVRRRGERQRVKVGSNEGTWNVQAWETDKKKKRKRIESSQWQPRNRILVLFPALSASFSRRKMKLLLYQSVLSPSLPRCPSVLFLARPRQGKKNRDSSLHSYLRLLPVLFLSILWNTPTDLFALTSVHARATERVFHELHEAAKLQSSAKRSKPVHPLAAGIPKIPSEIADGISL